MGLDYLRTNPEIEIRDGFYTLKSTPLVGEYGRFRDIGFRGTITDMGFWHRLNSHGVYNLKFNNDTAGHDFYFPYLNGRNGFGHVIVPEVNLVNGSIAITDGMNGCALEIFANKKERTYLFYHNQDGGNPINPGMDGYVRICRITSRAYLPNDIHRWMTEKGVNPFRCSPSIQFLCVYNTYLPNNPRWTIIACGVFFYQDKILGKFVPVNSKSIETRLFGLCNYDNFRIFLN